jgi:hypothetical protein
VPRLIRLAPSAALKERRLGRLLGERGVDEGSLAGEIQDAQLLGSLELAGFSFSWDEIKASRRTGPGPEAIRCLRGAQALREESFAPSVDGLLAWYGETTGRAPSFRTAPRDRVAGPPAAPVEFIRSRVESLVHWLSVDSSRELSPAQCGALALARLVEILPFDDANGRISRLAASHVMVRGGARPPILVGGDRPRLEQCLTAAFQLSMEPLTSLLEEASERALDVAIQTLERV